MANASNFEMTFRQVRDLVKNGGRDEELLGAVDKLLGAVLLLSPAVLGAAALPALGLIGAKNEIIKLAGGAVKKIARSSQPTFVDRGRHIVAAHCLLTYTAFFEALQDSLPEFVTAIDLSGQEQRRITEQAVAKIGALAGAPIRSQESDGPDPSRVLVSLPHPVVTRQQEGEHRRSLYELMTGQLLKFVTGLAEWERLDGGQRDEISARLRDLPSRAGEVYELQYLAFAAEVPEYFMWSELREHGRTQQLTVQLREKLDLIESAARSLDVGLGNLAGAIEVIARAQATDDSAIAVAEALNLTYSEWITEPVIDDRYDRRDEDAALEYPKKQDIFVPQGYKVLRHTDTRKPLEDERMWAGLESRDDLGAFVIRYLESVYSTESPLVVLGQPGSGKSLFTEILAARLRPPIFNAVRVKLRDIDAEAELQTQIEHQIRKDTGRDVDWPKFAEAFPDSPPVVILDGYDELLQASGKVYSGYLDKVHRFQRREATQKRPVRVIITSRITLIDKAVMPPGVTVLRLQEFDEPRQDAWISVWNQHNQDFFSRTGTQPFHPGNEEKILHLARQPLLLLMLAVYDSKENSLHHGDRLDQTRLYHSLLCRFMERERLKDDEGTLFRALSPREQTEQIEKDLERLGVAAVGMFNRQSLHITKEQLNRDVEYFDVERTIRSEDGGTRLSQAELLLGSFFFIHESRSKASGGTEAENESNPTAFEFLHNTFGEFLTADFILRNLLRETKTVAKLSGDDDFRSTLQQRLLLITKGWFACLCYSALHSRPVILEMLREWSGHRLRGEGRDVDSFLVNLDLLLREQLRSMLRGRPPEFLLDHDDTRPFAPLPIIGHMAVYSLNLVVLRTVLSPGPYVFDESLFAVDESGCLPWDRLVHLWRSWYSLEALSGVSAVLVSRREDGQVKLRSREAFSMPARRSRLDDVFNVAEALADNVTAGLAGLYVYDGSFEHRIDLDDMAERLRSVEIDLDVEIATRKAVDPRYQVRLGEIVEGSTSGEDSAPVDSRRLLGALGIFSREGVLTFGDLLETGLGPSSLGSFEEMSSWEVGIVVAIKGQLEPRWASDLLVKIADWDLQYMMSKEFVGSILGLTHAYPHSKGAVRLKAALLEQFDYGWIVAPETIEAAAGWAICGLSLDVKPLFHRSMSVISDRLLDGEWSEVEISVVSLNRLLELLIDAELAERDAAAFFVERVAGAFDRTMGGRLGVSSVVSVALRIAHCLPARSENLRRMAEEMGWHFEHYSWSLLDPLDVLLLIRLCRRYGYMNFVSDLFSAFLNSKMEGCESEGYFFEWMSKHTHSAISAETLDDLTWAAGTARSHYSR